MTREMPLVDMQLTGALAGASMGQLLTRALAAADVPMTDTQLITEVRALEASLPESDPDVGWVRFALNQLHTARFQTTNSMDDAELALAAARSLPLYSVIPPSVSSYERGRTAYQVGRRTGDQALLEEALHFYTVARNDLGIRDHLWWKLRRQRREVIALQEEFAHLTGAIYARPDTGELAVAEAGAFIDFAIEPFPAASDCRWPIGYRSRLPGAPKALYCAPLGLPGEVRLHRGPKPPAPHKRLGDLDDRGKPISGLVTGVVQSADDLVSHMSLLLYIPAPTSDAAEATLKRHAPELYEWGERVARWADVVTGRVPKWGAMMVTRYLYGDLILAGESRRLTLNADEAGITRYLRTEAGTPINRFEMSYILNHLARHEVPTAIEMLQLAEHSLLSDRPRQAVVEAGTAAEAALTILYDSYPITNPRHRAWSLGVLVKEANKAGILPNADNQATLERQLVTPRNDAVHRGHITRAQAVDAVDAASRIVDHAFGTRSHDVVALDRRMRELAPLLPPRPATRAGFMTPDGIWVPPASHADDEV